MGDSEEVARGGTCTVCVGRMFSYGIDCIDFVTTNLPIFI